MCARTIDHKSTSNYRPAKGFISPSCLDSFAKFAGELARGQACAYLEQKLATPLGLGGEALMFVSVVTSLAEQKSDKHSLALALFLTLTRTLTLILTGKLGQVWLRQTPTGSRLAGVTLRARYLS